MAKEEQQFVEWMDVEEAAKLRLTQPEIVSTLVDRAKAEGYEPIDFNYAGVPNVYLRGQFLRKSGQTIEEADELIGQGFCIVVGKKE